MPCGRRGWWRELLRGPGRPWEELNVENRVLKEAEVSLSVSPRARNGHEVGGEFLLKNTKLLVGVLTCDAGERPV